MLKNLYLICFIVLLSCNNTASSQNEAKTEPGNKDTGGAVKAQTTNQIQNTAKLKYGRYGCTASRYSNGSIGYTPRGSFTILPNGKYTYYGFKEPSSGTFTVDKEGNLFFKGGYFDGGKAEKIDRPDKFFLIFPTIPDNRWTCGWIDEK